MNVLQYHVVMPFLYTLYKYVTIILCVVQDGKTPLYIACYNGHDKVLQVFLDHSVKVDVPDKVSDISITTLTPTLTWENLIFNCYLIAIF